MKEQQIIQVELYHSPCGDLLLGSLEERLCLCDWMNEERRRQIDRRICRRLNARYEWGESLVIREAKQQLDAYFAGLRKSFDLPLLFVGTAFQQQVWAALLTIPYGETRSYKELAMQIGCPKAIRAVATANRANALSVFVPCHRVIGSDGCLVGYAGGLAAKSRLLRLES